MWNVRSVSVALVWGLMLAFQGLDLMDAPKRVGACETAQKKVESSHFAIAGSLGSLVGCACVKGPLNTVARSHVPNQPS